MGLGFFNNLKENLEKNDTLSKVVEGVTEFIGELADALQKENGVPNSMDIVSEIASKNKLSISTKNGISQTRNEVLNQYAKENDFYYVLNKIENKDEYRVWEFNDGKRSQVNMNEKDLPKDAGVNSVLKMENNELVTDKEATEAITNKINDKANELIQEQNKKIQDYKKEGHTYVVTEDINGRVFLWDSTEKPSYEIEDINFPDELKDKAKEGSSFLYQNGTYTYLG